MKEHLQSNIITKHLAGLATAEEKRFIREWLNKNPQHAVTYQVIRQRFMQVTANLDLNTL
jgi:hypothetical protein